MTSNGQFYRLAFTLRRSRTFCRVKEGMIKAFKVSAGVGFFHAKHRGRMRFGNKYKSF